LRIIIFILIRRPLGNGGLLSGRLNVDYRITTTPERSVKAVERPRK